ncbi:MAG: hypothetical protein MZV64_33495 [Ignavibacteriales bacterium]|nr:hypothetical protein [Ignavibacteriales bacterium]
MQAGVAYILGPGTTTRAIAQELNVEKTLVGVDVVRDGKLIAKDVTQAQLLSLTRNHAGKDHRHADWRAGIPVRARQPADRSRSDPQGRAREHHRGQHIR